MRHWVGEEEEKGYFVCLRNEFDRIVSLASREGVLINGMFDFGGVLVEPERDIGLDPGSPHVIGVRKSLPVVESFAHR